MYAGERKIGVQKDDYMFIIRDEKIVVIREKN